MRWVYLLLTGCVIFSTSTFAKENDENKSNLEISIYNNNLALVKDTRTISVTEGKNEIAFEGVSMQIKPETAIFYASGLSVLEQNYNYDLLTYDNLINQSINQEVKTVIFNTENGQNVFDKAQIIGAVQGQPILKFDYGIEASFPGRLVFDKIPNNLENKPTLNAKIISNKTELKNISLAYLTTGMEWESNYVAKVSSPHKLDLTGWITINNESGIDYDNAKVQVIAGDVHQVMNNNIVQPVMLMAKSARTTNDMQNFSISPQEISGYHLYNLPFKTDIKNKQTKQISLFEKKGVDYKKEIYMMSPFYFTYNMPTEFKQQNPQLIYIIENKTEDNLGLPMPAGVIRFYENDNRENLQFIGEDRINHVAEGAEIRLDLGKYFDIFINGKINKITKLKEEKTKETEDMCYTLVRQYAYDVEITFYNSNKLEQEIVFEQDISPESKLEKSNISGQFKDADSYLWKVNIPKQSEQTLSFRIIVPNVSKSCR